MSVVLWTRTAGHHVRVRRDVPKYLDKTPRSPRYSTHSVCSSIVCVPVNFAISHFGICNRILLQLDFGYCTRLGTGEIRSIGRGVTLRIAGLHGLKGLGFGGLAGSNNTW